MKKITEKWIRNKNVQDYLGEQKIYAHFLADYTVKPAELENDNVMLVTACECCHQKKTTRLSLEEGKAISDAILSAILTIKSECIPKKINLNFKKHLSKLLFLDISII